MPSIFDDSKVIYFFYPINSSNLFQLEFKSDDINDFMENGDYGIDGDDGADVSNKF